MRPIAAALSAAFVILPIACEKSPQTVCDKIADLVKSSSDAPKASSDRDSCQKQLEAMKAKDPSAYKCTAECVMNAGDAKTAQDCLGKCK